jgi:hypothetical protein
MSDEAGREGSSGDVLLGSLIVMQGAFGQEEGFSINHPCQTGE